MAIFKETLNKAALFKTPVLGGASRPVRRLFLSSAAWEAGPFGFDRRVCRPFFGAAPGWPPIFHCGAAAVRPPISTLARPKSM